MATTVTRRKPVNLSLDTLLVEQAKAYGINVSRACEAGLAAVLTKTREQKWREENREAIESSNAYVEEHGLPLAKYRMF